MKTIIKYLYAVAALVLVFSACKKVADLPFYDNGKSVTLTASATSIVPTPADSTKDVVVFSWTDPQYSVDSNSVKYLLEIDSTGRNFTSKVTKELKGSRSASLTGRELNNLLLGYGFTVGAPYKLDVRVVSSYANNNDLYTSNVITITVTPFSDPSALTSTTTTVTATEATSSQNATTFSWSPSFKGYNGNVTYSLEYDSSGKNFASPHNVPLTAGMFSKSLTIGEINLHALDEGVTPGSTGKVDYRIKAMTALGAVAYSNVISISISTYDPIRVQPPASGRLFIVGSATQGGWNNPVPVPSQELTRVDATTFVGIFELNGGQSYLLLPVNGDWSAKFGGTGANNTNNPSGDSFMAGGSDMIAPATSGWYKMVFDFKAGTFTVTPYTQQHGMPAELFIVGGATPGGWNNPVPVPSQQFTRMTSTKFQINSLALTAGEKYLFLPENGNWGKKFGAVDGNAPNIGLGGPFAPEGQDMPAPTVSGNYRIEVDFATNTYKLTKL